MKKTDPQAILDQYANVLAEEWAKAELVLPADRTPEQIDDYLAAVEATEAARLAFQAEVPILSNCRAGG